MSSGPERSAPSPEIITAVDAVDVRFPTSRHLDGSDALNPEPDYSAAYVTIRTSGGAAGHGLAFTVGRGNDVAVAAVRALTPLVVGLPVDGVLADLRAFSQRLTGDSQLRWLGPYKGVVHMAAAAIVNAVWDLYGRRAGKPVWQLLSELSPEQLVDLVDFRYLNDALTRVEALRILREAEPGRAERTAKLLAHGYPAYTTTPGWLGYTDEKLVRLAREAVADGFTQIKLKVGADLADDIRRLRLARPAVQGKTFKPGPTDHDSTIIQVRAGLLEDQLSAPLVTADGAAYGGIASLKSTDTSLWGNHLG